MSENKHTMQDLYQYQALPLSLKILMTKRRIRDWVNAYGESGVYVSFSGGKDSTVLLNLVRQDYPNVPAVFVDTGLEYPEIRDFVKTFDNVIWIRPKMTFKQVIEKYGYPMFSKEISLYIRQLMEKPTEKNAKTRNLRMYGIRSDGKIVSTGKLPNKYMFMLKSPYKISNSCCDVIKKSPLHIYSHKEKRYPITAEMASESRIRTQRWLKGGCNGFDLKEPKSTPMAFWTEQDVLLYIKMNHLQICSVYGNIVEDRTGTDEVEGQLTMSDIEGWEKMGMFDADRLPLKTTGCNRTGCMFCGYGCHLEKEGEGRFERMKETHPKQYEYIMKPWEDGGLGYKEVIDWINEHGNMNIRY